MAQEIFKTQLKLLNDINSKLNVVSQSIENKMYKPFDKVTRKLTTLKQVVGSLNKSFEMVFSSLKRITFSLIGVSGIMAYKGVGAIKQTSEARGLGINSKQSGALEYAGKIQQGDAGFYKNILKNIKGSLTNYTENAEDFAKLGLTDKDLEGKSPFEMITKVLQNAQNSKLNSTILNKSLQNITGIDLNTLKGLDLDKMQGLFSEGLDYSSGNKEDLSKVGESFHRAIAGIGAILDKMASAVSPALIAFFDGIAKATQAILRNEKFLGMLDALNKWAKDFASILSDKFNYFNQNLTAIFEKMQEIMYRVVSALANAFYYASFGRSKGAKELSQKYDDMADKLANSQKERERANQELKENNIKIQGDTREANANINITLKDENGQEMKRLNQSFNFSGGLKNAGNK